MARGRFPEPAARRWELLPRLKRRRAEDKSFKKKSKEEDKRINQSDERREKGEKEKEQRWMGFVVSSVIQIDASLTGKDGPAGCCATLEVSAAGSGFAAKRGSELRDSCK